MEKRLTKEAEGAQVRPKRTPLGSRNVLAVASRPGYHRAWISDSLTSRPSIFDCLAAGYTFVEDPVKVGDSTINSANPTATAVSRPGGRGVTLLLMEQLQEYYDADRAAEEASIRELEMSMYRPSSDGGYGKVKKKDTHSPQSPIELTE